MKLLPIGCQEQPRQETLELFFNLHIDIIAPPTFPLHTPRSISLLFGFQSSRPCLLLLTLVKGRDAFHTYYSR